MRLLDLLQFPFRRFFLFSYLLTNAFPKMGLYVAIAVLFYQLDLMNTFTGIVLIHIINTLMYMTWIPSAAFENVTSLTRGSCKRCWSVTF